MASITETPNELTGDADVLSPLQFVRLLRQTDAQMFAGWREHPGLNDEVFIEALEKVIAVAQPLLKNPKDNLVVLSGSGTSGRIAFLVARAFNEVLRARGLEECFRYLCAGGDVALFASREAPEDNWMLGREALEKVCQTAVGQVLYIGITCGLSAPFVASQLDYCLEHGSPRFIPVLLGFNPLHLARDMPIEGWDKTFKDVVNNMEARASNHPGSCFFLTPVIGPEPITGSTRMKGGSATKIILEVLFSLALSSSQEISRPGQIALLFQEYENIVRELYFSSPAISELVRRAGDALKSGGRIVYVSHDTYGIAGLVDASECPPTYNARNEDVRCFILGEYATMRNSSGSLAELGSMFRFGFSDLITEYIPTVTEKDFMLFVSGPSISSSQGTPLKDILESINSLGLKCSINLLSIGSSMTETLAKYPLLASWSASSLSCVPLSHVALSSCTSLPFLAELATKLCLNAITTGAHITKGKVLDNRMIDLQVSNNKLFYRAIGIIQQYSKVSHEEGRVVLLKSIYRTDSLSSSELNGDISVHIANAVAAAQEGHQVVPCAIVMGKASLSYHEAALLLAKHPVIRNALKQ